MQKPTLAVVVLTLNEECCLRRCLESVTWADQVLVLDSGSIDQTVSIAMGFSVSVIHRKATPFLISQQRNHALLHGGLATDWVLFVDADEVVTEECKRQILSAIQTAPPDIVGFRLAPKFIFLDRWLKHVQTYPVWHDRLLRRGEVWFAGGVWEYFDTDKRVECIQEPYLHYSLSKGIGEWFIKHERYASVEANDILVTLGILTPDENQLTKRKRSLRNWAARFWPLRPVIRFVYIYGIRKGFLDGMPGLLYSLMIACYEFMIVLKVVEYKNKRVIK